MDAFTHYGNDESVPANSARDPLVRTVAAGVGILVPPESLSRSGLATEKCCGLFGFCEETLEKHHERECTVANKDEVVSCTATLVGRKHVLTARHCAPPDLSRRVVVFGFADGESIGSSSEFVKESRFQSPESCISGSLCDWVLLETQSCFPEGQVVKWRDVPTREEGSEQLAVLSYPLGMPLTLSPGQFWPKPAAGAKSFVHNNDLLDGSSGAPALFPSESRDEYQLIGMLTKGDSLTGRPWPPACREGDNCRKLKLFYNSPLSQHNVSVVPGCRYAEPESACQGDGDLRPQILERIGAGNECCRDQNCQAVKEAAG